MQYRYAVWDKRSRVWDEFTSQTPPTLEIHLSNGPWRTLDDYRIELPQDAHFVARNDVPHGPDAIIANWTEREDGQPLMPEAASDAAMLEFRIGLGVFLTGVLLGTTLKL